MKSLFAATFTALASFAAPSLAAPITEGVYQLQNNSDHALGAAGFYRYNGSGFDLYDFETNGAEVLLTYDAGAGTVDLAGTAYDTVGERLVNFDLGYIGVTSTDGGIVTSFTGLAGTFDGVDVTGALNRQQRSLFIESLAFEQSALGDAWVGSEAGHFGDFHFEGIRVGNLPNGSVPVPGGLAFLLVGAAAFYSRKRSAK